MLSGCNITLYVFQGQEYAPQYLLEYQRLNEGRWLRYRGHEGDEVGTVQCHHVRHIAEMSENWANCAALL